MPPDPPKKPKDAAQRFGHDVVEASKSVSKWIKDTAEWIKENLGDPAISATIRADLGMGTGSTGNMPAFAKSGDIDPEKESFAETVAMLKPAVEELVAFGDLIKGGDLTAFDAIYLLSRVAATDSVRLRAPALYGLARLLQFVSEDPEHVATLGTDVFVGLLTGRGFPEGAGDQAVRVVDQVALFASILEAVLSRSDVPITIDSYYGWDPAPGSATPTADDVSARTSTILLRKQQGQAAAETLSLTMVGVPSEHQGPGMMLGFGGGLKLVPVAGDTIATFEASATAGAVVFIPFRAGEPGFKMMKASPGFTFKTSLTRRNPDAAAFRLGSATGTRFEAKAMRLGVEINGDDAAVSFRLEEAALFLDLGEQSFLRQLQREPLKIEIDVGFSLSSKKGFGLEGGDRIRVSLPIGKTIGGIFTIFSLTLELAPGVGTADLRLVLAGGFALKLGPFKGVVDQMGLQADLGFHRGNLGFIDLALGFRPPKGIGLTLDAGVVKGGGYLGIDTERGRFTGALELKLGPIGIKALAVISSKLPDGSEGWGILLAIYGDFPPIQLSFGFVLTGIGGMIGLQHGVDLEAIRAGLSSGVLNDVLFPRDPVGEAPRIITSLMTIFPPKKLALSMGPMVETGWGTPLIVALRLGLLFQLDNVLGGDRPVSVSKITMLGVLTADLPFRNDANLTIVHFECDFVGYVDFDNERLGFEAVLRNSRVLGVLELSGGIAIYLAYGASPEFILSAGGMHPSIPPPAGFKPPARLGLVQQLGPVKMRVEIYFAVTPATVQAGALIELTYGVEDIGELRGMLSFDAVCHFDPFSFRVDVHASLAVTVFGETLAGIFLEGTLEGPGHWVIDGKARIKLPLLPSIRLHVHEEFGEPPPEVAGTRSVAQLLGQAVNSPSSWSAQLSPDSESLITLGHIDAGGDLLAHPLGVLRFTQNVCPLGLTLEKYGNAKIDGPTRFDVERVDLEGVAGPGFVAESQLFARSQFLELSPERRLADPEFERFPSGIRFASDAYTLPPAAEILETSIEIETKDYDIPDASGGAEVSFTLRSDMLAWQSLAGSGARSPMRRAAALQPAASRSGRTRLQVTPPAYTAVDLATMLSIPEAGSTAARSLMVQRVAELSRSAVVVEAFEVAGFGGQP